MGNYHITGSCLDFYDHQYIMCYRLCTRSVVTVNYLEKAVFVLPAISVGIDGEYCDQLIFFKGTIF